MSCIKDLVDIAAVLNRPFETVILPEGLLYILHKDTDGRAYYDAFISEYVWNNTVLKSIADRLELELQIDEYVEVDQQGISLGDISILKYPDGTALYCTMRETQSNVYYGIWVDLKNYGFPPTLREDIIPKAGFKEIDVYNDIAVISSLKVAGYPSEFLNKRLIRGPVIGYILRK